jgi:hypothetical protein
VIAAVLASARDAHASGALVSSPPGAAEIAEVEIAVASTPSRTTRWSRLHVTGAASAFVWIVPVRPGAMMDVASDAWMEALQASTAPRVLPPSAESACTTPRDPEVTARTQHLVTRAPSEVNVVSDASSLAAALGAWGFALPIDLDAGVRAVLASGDRLALLLFTANAKTTVTATVRVVDDAAPAIPLLLTHGGTSDVRVTAYAIASGRQDFGALPAIEIPAAAVRWKKDGTSTYVAARDAALSSGSNAWLVEASGQSPVFALQSFEGGAIPPLADSYFARAGIYGDATLDVASCAASARAQAASGHLVASACPRGALARVPGSNGIPTCSEGPSTIELSPDLFRCGGLADDLAHAFSAQAPAATWVTRAESVVSAGVYGVDAKVASSAAAERSRVVVASGYDFVCGDPRPPGGSSGGNGGSGSGGGGPPLPVDPSPVVGAVVETDPPVDSSAPGEGCDGSSVGDGCGGSTTATTSDSGSSSSDSCSSSSSSDSSGVRRLELLFVDDERLRGGESVARSAKESDVARRAGAPRARRNGATDDAGWLPNRRSLRYDEPCARLSLLLARFPSLRSFS